MFHTILTLSYLIPGIYLFVRIWQLFITRKYSLPYALLFSLVFSVYPLGNMLENETPGLSHAAGILSGYLLPFLLYLFLLVLITDILLLLNSIIKIIPTVRLKERKFRKKYFVSILSLSLLIVIAGIINFNTVRITEYTVSIPRRASELTSLRIAFVSDFHLDEKVPGKFVDQFVEKIRKADPDLLLYGGDIVEGRGENIQLFERKLKTIHTDFGGFGVMGNHDRFTDFSDNFFTRAGITLLRDSIAVAGNHFAVAGRIDNRSGREKAETLADRSPSHLPLILVDHRPTDFDDISNTRADIVFSGHTHKGQMFPINLYIRSLYELSYGYMKKNDTHFFVSSGIRLWGPPVRTTGKSEIVIVNAEFLDQISYW